MRITSKEYKDAQRALNYSMSNILDNAQMAKRPNLNLDNIIKPGDVFTSEGSLNKDGTLKRYIAGEPEREDILPNILTMDKQVIEDKIKGAFKSADDLTQERIMEGVAIYHIRNGVQHSDGSMGEVRITNREMNDLIAYFIEYYSER